MNKRFCHASFYLHFFSLFSFLFRSQFSLIDNFTLALDVGGFGASCLFARIIVVIKRQQQHQEQQPRICHPSKLNHTFYYLPHSMASNMPIDQ